MDGHALTPHEPFDSERSPFNRQMAAGHLMRCGHKLAGYYVPVPGIAGVVKLVRTCCAQTECRDSGAPIDADEE